MRIRKTGKAAWIWMLSVVMAITCTACTQEQKKTESRVLRVWYCEDEMTDYLTLAAAEYEKQTGVRVECSRIDSKQYLEQIAGASLKEAEDVPDLYLLRNDELGRACMEGIAAPNRAEDYNSERYCDTALRAASYQDTLMAYPLYYNTACMLTNTDYFPEAPATMGAITSFSETAQIDENIQYILYWDVNDYLCNYPFIGKYIDIGGTNGDDAQSLSIVNEQTVQCLQSFQQMGQYFAIDSETIQTEDVPAALMEGRALCILADSSMVHEINWYVVNNGVEIPYHISPVPGITDELESCAGSYTELVVVNGLGMQQEASAELAEYLSDEFVGHLYDLSGHFAAKRDVSFENAELEELYRVYEQSEPFPKLLEAEDNKVWLEVLFANVWGGADIGQELQNYSDKMTARMNK